jgi:hypothetical protein
MALERVHKFSIDWRESSTEATGLTVVFIAEREFIYGSSAAPAKKKDKQHAYNQYFNRVPRDYIITVARLVFSTLFKVEETKVKVEGKKRFGWFIMPPSTTAWLFDILMPEDLVKDKR